MKEKYSAKKNGVVNSKDSDLEVPEKSEKEQNEESTAKALEAGVDIGLDIYTGGAYSQVKDKISKIPVAGKMANDAWNKKINSVAKKVSKTPVGDVAKKLDDSGATDAVKGGYDAISGAKSGDVKKATEGASKLKDSSGKLGSLFGGGSKSGGSSDIMSQFGFGKAFKIKLIVGGCLCLFLIFMIVAIFAMKDQKNLDLTNKSSMTSKTRNGGVCTTTDIETKLIYVGDSRSVGMQSAINNSNITFIAQSSMGYSWLKSTAQTELESKLTENADVIVVFALGVNDLYNIDNYISVYNEIINKYSSTKFFILSVNPVDDSISSEAKNSDIEVFNQKLQSAFSDKYLDSYGGLTTNFNTTDGVHYDNDTYIAINNYVLSSISSSSQVTCSNASSGALGSDLETVGKWYIENVSTYQNGNSGSRKYYKTPFGTRSFGDDCTEFAALYMSFISGVDLSESYSGGMIDPNGAWAQEVAKYGWKAHTSDEIGSSENLQTGDVMIAHSGSLYSTKGHHAEIYIDSQSTFGWGSVKKAYPTSNIIVASNFGGHVHFMDGGHDYVTIYRFEG